VLHVIVVLIIIHVNHVQGIFMRYLGYLLSAQVLDAYNENYLYTWLYHNAIGIWNLDQASNVSLY
jgi:hypothetical protein